MKKRKWRRIVKTQRFSLHQAVGEPGSFSARWRKRPGEYGERVFQALSAEDAIHQAPAVIGYEATKIRRPVPLADAFAGALAASKRGESARKDWKGSVRRFAEWLVANHPKIGDWNQLTRQIVREYQRSLDHLSPNGQRMAVQPIQQTDTHMARDHGFARIADALQISRALAKPTAKVFLADVVEFCDWLREHEPRLECGVALQGLVGLRLQEAQRLTWERVQVDRGLIEISGEVKTEWSLRLIPVCGRVQEALKRGKARRVDSKVQTVSGDMVIEDFQTWKGYSAAVGKALRRWNPRVEWKSKDLRNAIPTWGTTNGLKTDLLKQYIGQAPEGVMARHYVPRLAAATAGEWKETEKAMDLFRSQIVEPIEAAIQVHECSGIPPFST